MRGVFRARFVRNAARKTPTHVLINKYYRNYRKSRYWAHKNIRKARFIARVAAIQKAELKRRLGPEDMWG